MILIVENKDINRSFIPYLKKRLLGYITLILELRKLTKYDEYFASEDFGNVTQIPINPRKVIMLGMTNLQHKRYKTTTHIFINPNLYYPGTPYKVVELCKLINYGSLSVEGYPIFSDTFEHFQKSIHKYTDKPMLGGW